MRKNYLFLAFLLMSFGLQAQYIYNDFDANQNETFLGWPNAPTVIANPDMSGINTSANVAEWVRTEETWAHVSCELDGKIDFTTGTTFMVKAWVPVACTVMFKLEDKANGAVFTELPAEVTTAGEWVQLNYDFSGAGSDLYDKIVIFFDFANPVDNTFYFDDVEGPEYEEGTTGDPVTLPVTFEDENVNYGLTDFGGNSSEIVEDPTDETNTVAKTTKMDGAETWAGTTVGGAVGFPEPIPFTEGSTTMTVDVWSPTAGTPIRLKVEDSGVPEISVETEAMTTSEMSWETLEFDFSNEAEGTAEINYSYNYNKASIFFNFDTPGGGETYYWDNMDFGELTGILDNKPIEVQVYPNPATDVLFVEDPSDLQSINIFSVSGQVIYHSEQIGHSIDLSDFPAGMYTMRATGIDGTQYFAKFMVK